MRTQLISTQYAAAPTGAGSDDVRAQAGASGGGTAGSIIVPDAPVVLASINGNLSTPAGIILGLIVAVLLIVFIVVPIFKGIGWLIGGFFRGIGWLAAHLFTFVRGMLGDLVRAVGAVITTLLFVPMVLLNVVIGRWSAASHYGRAIQDEVRAFGHCLYRVAIGHPARLLLLGGLTEGIEQRVPQAMQQAPGSDKPSGRVGQFDGYRIVGSLTAGGSGGKLYVAEPTASKAAAIARAAGRSVGQVVIKAFSLRDGSTMPQIVRESRALEAARKLGLILDHELNDERFYYVMPYVPGDSLTVVTKRLHAEAGPDGLGEKQLRSALSHTCDLLGELDYYHRGGLWHKDVKPDNIIVHDDKAHLVDLGLVTPLRSGMTLTTHGTEYFRDPELVRMALRGAKVNEVDGVKFDIYGAGAVLYSIVENSFPAHGALSQITRRCPEALRWIIRRSMAEMSQRYASASQMLGDLRFLGACADPFSVKPFELPSMAPGGGGAGSPAPVDLEPRVEAVSFGRTTPPPVPAGAAAAPEAARVGEGFMGVGAAAGAAAGIGAGVAAAGAAVGGSAARTRPVIRVIDWWTGRYRVVGETPEAPAAKAGGPIPIPVRDRGPGRTAAEQLAAARERVQRVQERVRSGRFRSGARVRGVNGVRGAGAFKGPVQIGLSLGTKRYSYSNGPNAGVVIAVAVMFVALVFSLSGGSKKRSGVVTAEAPQAFALDVDSPGDNRLDVSREGIGALGAAHDSQDDTGLPGAPAPRSIVVGGRTVAEVHGASEFEQKLDLAVQDFDRRISQARANGDVNLRSYGEAFTQTVRSWWKSGGMEFGVTRPRNRGGANAGTAGASAPAQPQEPPAAPAPVIAASATGDEGCTKPGHVLVVSFLPLTGRDERHEKLDLMVNRLRIGGYCVEGLGANSDDQELSAGVRSAIGLSRPNDADAVARVRSWLDEHPILGAVLWMPSDATDRPILLRSGHLDPASRDDLTETISGAR